MQEFDAVVYLENVVGAMRRLGVLEFDGIKLGPDPRSEAGETSTQPNSSPVQAEVAARQAQRRILTSGGPRPGLVAP